MAKVLVVEDDVEVALSVRDWLTQEQHTVDVVHDGQEGLDRITHYEYDVIVLDLNLPGMDGLEVCSSYRRNGGSAFVIMLTGKDQVTDKERGLDSGADDYLTKPFNVRELSARVRAVTRRSSRLAAPTGRLQVRDIELDLKSKAVFKDGERIHLLPREFALLEFLMRNPGEVFSQETIMDRVWSSESEVSPDTVRVHIRRIRGKLNDRNPDAPIIRTVHRQGYCLEP